MSISRPPNLQYSFKSPCRQCFSFPSDVITIILNNCDSPQIFQKLQKTCKYFFLKKKVIVLDTQVNWGPKCMRFFVKKNWDSGKVGQFIQNFKYWLNGNLFVCSMKFSERFKFVYRSNLKLIYNWGDVNYTYNEMSLLIDGGDIEELYLCGASIKYVDGKPVTIDEILSKCPKIREVSYQNKCEPFSSTTFEKLYQLKFINKFEMFSLHISQVFMEKEDKNQIDPKIFCEFLKKNLAHSAGLFISFKCHISNFDHFHEFVNSVFKNYLKKISIRHDF